jgi:hypothetical protein
LITPVFTAVSENLAELEVLIINRSGRIIHSWYAIKGSWDGRTFAGSIVPDGTYVYMAKHSYYESSFYRKKEDVGPVTLLR